MSDSSLSSLNNPHQGDKPSRFLRESLPPGSDPQQDRILVAVAFVGALALYAWTCAPGVLWQDSAMFQHRVFFFDLRGESGLPLAHPLYILMARAFALAIPFGDFAGRVNLFSALCGAAGIALLMKLLLNLTHSRLAAAVGSIALAVSHTYWTHSVIAEVYNLYAVGLLVECLCIERFATSRRTRWLQFALFTCGLNLSNHLLALLHLPAYAALILQSIRSNAIKPRQVGFLAIAMFLGATPYTWLIVGNLMSGQSLGDALSEALVGPPERSAKVLAVHFSWAAQTLRTAQYFLLNFPTPLLFIIPFGLKRLHQMTTTRPIALFLMVIFCVDFIFAFRYPVPDQFVFFTPCFVILAILIGFGVASITTSANMAVNKAPALVAAAILPVLVYAAAPSLLTRFHIQIGARRDIPFRDTLRYFVQPWKCGNDSAERYALAALRKAAPDGLVYADTTIKNVLVYIRDVEHREPNVTLTTGHDTIPLPPRIDRIPGDVEPFVLAGKAYVCSMAPDYVPEWMRQRWDFKPDGILFRIVPRK